MSAPLQNTFFKTNITGNLDIAGNLSVNSQNVYLGYLAGSTNVANVDNMKNVAIGSSCATYQTGSNNVSIGYDAATNSTTTYTGANNVSIGYNSGFNGSGASNGVAIGVNSLIDFSGSIAIGSASTATGFRNIAIGASSTSNGTVSVGNSIAIGVGANSGSYGNSVAIGPGATCTTNNQITIGTSNTSIVMPAMYKNYIYYYDTTGKTISYSPGSTLTTITFDTPINTNTSLFRYDSNGNFVNVSGRTLNCMITFSCRTVTGTTAMYIYQCIIYLNGNRFASMTLANAILTACRVSVTGVMRMNPNDYIYGGVTADAAASGSTRAFFNDSSGYPRMMIIAF
jgi:acetyltransferase-like isoleucine patch superfamily enzyme